MGTQQQDPLRMEHPRQTAEDFALQLIVEISERQVTAQDEIEPTCGGISTDIVAKKLDATSIRWLQTVTVTLGDKGSLSPSFWKFGETAGSIAAGTRSIERIGLAIGCQNAQSPPVLASAKAPH